jgi:hypothetical protein
MQRSRWYLMTCCAWTLGLAAASAAGATPAQAQCSQTGWTQPVIGWDLAVGSGIKVTGPDGSMVFPWHSCAAGIQPVMQLKGPRPYGRTAAAGCYYIVEMPYRNAGMQPTPWLRLYVAASAMFQTAGAYSGWNMPQQVTLSLAPGQVALIRGKLTVLSGQAQLSGTLDDVNGGGNSHPPDPRPSNNTGQVSITVPEGC